MKTVTFYEFLVTNENVTQHNAIETNGKRCLSVIVTLDTLIKAQRAAKRFKDMGWIVGPISFPQYSADTDVDQAVADAQRLIA